MGEDRTPKQGSQNEAEKPSQNRPSPKSGADDRKRNPGPGARPDTNPSMESEPKRGRDPGGPIRSPGRKAGGTGETEAERPPPGKPAKEKPRTASLPEGLGEENPSPKPQQQEGHPNLWVSHPAMGVWGRFI